MYLIFLTGSRLSSCNHHRPLTTDCKVGPQEPHMMLLESKAQSFKACHHDIYLKHTLAGIDPNGIPYRLH